MLRSLSCLLAVCVMAAPACATDEKPRPQVYVFLWFDTEDYILPASDDAAMHLAQYLTKQGVKATFKIVGHKARTLENRKRADVIEALKKHEIGYHSNWHSTQPTPAMYLSNLGWDEGVAEFIRREGPGLDDVKRIFGQSPSCYGQPGSSWGPQSYGALKKWDMIYLDAGRHVALDGKPCYYAGVFNLYQITYTIRADLNKPDDLEKATTRFAEARQALLKEGGGVISIVYHPCEWVHKQFWDGVNFAKGANPPPEKWKLPPQKSADETKQSFRIFHDYIQFIKRFDDVKFLTGREVAKLYRDRARGKKFTPEEIARVARSVGDEIHFQKHGDFTLTASEVFDLLTRYVAQRATGRKVESVELKDTPLGPTAEPPDFTEAGTTDDSQFIRTTADVVEYVSKHRRIPSAVWLGSLAVTPEAYLRALAKVAVELHAGKKVPATIKVQPTKLITAKHVANDDPRLWGWVIFPPRMKAPAMMQLAKKQAWALKPAVLGK